MKKVSRRNYHERFAIWVYAWEDIFSTREGSHRAIEVAQADIAVWVRFEIKLGRCLPQDHRNGNKASKRIKEAKNSQNSKNAHVPKVYPKCTQRSTRRCHPVCLTRLSRLALRSMLESMDSSRHQLLEHPCPREKKLKKWNNNIE